MAAPMAAFSEGKAKNDLFRERFKYYKRKVPPPDFSEVLDFRSCNISSNQQVEPYLLKTSNHDVAGLKRVQDWKAYTIKNVPGFVFISSPFRPGGERYWVERCLKHYTNRPYVSNLDKHQTTADGLWERAKISKDKSSAMDKLRWMTLGYHHDWDTKHYRADFHDDMPDDLVLLCEHIAATVGYEKYRSEAAIINYYHMDSTLSGHTDHSEFDLESPLMSISLGQSAIFLVGGTTKDVCPHAMFLRSGDMAIMMKESRLSYHAIPRIVSDPDALVDPKALDDSYTSIGKERCLDSCENKSRHDATNESIAERLCDIDWTEYADYMKTCRLNMNVRQVLLPGQSFPKETIQDQQEHSNKKQKLL